MTFVEYIASPPVFVAVAAALGLAIGSFLNVVIHRLPKMMEREWQAQCAELRGETPPAQPRYDLVTPRSGCPSCGHRITALENIPIASYLWLRGKCSACRAPIGIRYPTVEALTGLAIGSFLNVVIHRLPKMMEREWQAQCAELRSETPPAQPRYDLVMPRSGCPSCGHQITAFENIPLASYLWLRGKCSACRAPIGIRYPVIEALTGVATAYCAWHFGFGYAALGAMLFTWCMIALAAIDIDTQLLPDSITLPLLWAGLLFNLRGTLVDLQSAVIGAVAGYLVLWLVYWAFKFATGKEGMGFGDFKLLAAIGAWLGW